MNGPERRRWLRRFDEPEHARSRVIVLPHAGGSASYYRELSRALRGAGVECLAVQYPGRQDRFGEEMASTIEAYGDRIAEALSGWDDKPALLLGHSMGALIAYDMLQRHGSGLGFIDGFVASAHPPPRSGSSLESMSEERVRDYLRRLGGLDEKLLDDPAVMEIVLPAMKNDLEAVLAYRRTAPAKLDMPITAVVGLQDPHVQAEAAAGWEDWTRDSFELVSLPGGHFYFADAPEELCGVLLRAARRRKPAAAAGQPPGTVREYSTRRGLEL
ncbi:thioesterase II family protein [Paenibacillus humicus]|uniref:thioesterase II family protein n=1 Tax=Paenibacillus humicus TaxID=412861 RepID=UPI003F17F3E0